MKYKFYITLLFYIDLRLYVCKLFRFIFLYNIFVTNAFSLHCIAFPVNMLQINIVYFVKFDKEFSNDSNLFPLIFNTYTPTLKFKINTTFNTAYLCIYALFFVIFHFQM